LNGLSGGLCYLDHAATSPLRPEAAEAMAPFGADRYGNASGAHAMARDARTALEEAREVVAATVGAAPSEVVFTSGGTEADNLAVFGTLARCAEGHGPISAVCSSVEHAAVLAPLRAASRGAAAVLGVGRIRVREVGVDASARVDLDALDDALDDTTALVSVMAANNEVGTLQPLDQVAALVRRRAPAAALHTDAVQAAPYLDLPAVAGGCDLVSLSAHKLGGPKGVGALVVRAPLRLAPMLHGGGQEQERRSGTHDVAGIVGFAAAARAAAERRDGEAARVAGLRDRFADLVCSAVPGVVESVARSATLPGFCHLRFLGIEQEELLVLLDRAGVCASAGSACASGAVEPSHVLLAMGVGSEEARSGIRFSLGHTTTEGEVARAAHGVADAAAQLRG